MSGHWAREPCGTAGGEGTKPQRQQQGRPALPGPGQGQDLVVLQRPRAGGVPPALTASQNNTRRNTNETISHQTRMPHLPGPHTTQERQQPAAQTGPLNATCCPRPWPLHPPAARGWPLGRPRHPSSGGVAWADGPRVPSPAAPHAPHAGPRLSCLCPSRVRGPPWLQHRRHSSQTTTLARLPTTPAAKTEPGDEPTGDQSRACHSHPPREAGAGHREM